MKNSLRLLLLVSCLFSLPHLHAATTLFQEEFDGANATIPGGSTRTDTTTFISDGDNDYYGIYDGTNILQSDATTVIAATTGVPAFTGASGGTYLTGEDHDGDGGPNPIEMNWTGINISGFTNLQLSGLFGSSSTGTSGFDTTDYIHIDYQIDGGGFTNLLHFESINNPNSNEPVQQDTDFDGHGDGGVSLALALANFSAAIGATGASLDLRLTVAAGSGSEDWAADNITVTGDTAADPGTYWDTDSGNAGGSTGTTADGNWSGTNWNDDSTGAGDNGAWDNNGGTGSVATFSAGTDVTGPSTISSDLANTVVTGISVEEGDITISDGGQGIALNEAPTGTGEGDATAADVNVATGSTLTVAVGFTDDGTAGDGLNKLGDGKLTLGGPNSFTGGMTVTAGEVDVTGTLDDSTVVTVEAAGTYTVSNIDTIAGVNNSGTVNVDHKLIVDGAYDATGTTAISANGTLNADSGTVSGVVSGAGNIIKNDAAGTMTLSGNNTFTGGIIVNEGTVILDVSDNAAGTGLITMNDGNLFATDGRTICNDILVPSGQADLQLYLEDFTGEAGKGAVGNGDPASPTIDVSGVDWTIDVQNAQLLDANDFFQVIDVGGDERFVMQDTNVFQGVGPTTFDELTDLPAWKSPLIDVSNYDNVELTLDAFFNASESFYDQGNNVGEGDDMLIYVIVDGQRELLFDALPGLSTDPDKAGPDLATDFANLAETISVAGSTMQIEIYANGYAAGETIGWDNIKIEGDSKGGGDVVIGDNTGGTSTFCGNVTLENNVTLTAAAGGQSTFTGNITDQVGTNAVTKTGAGEVILTGTNTYDGATTVSAGTLIVNGDNSAANGAVTTDAGTTLAGTGTIGGNTTLNGNLAAGNDAVAGTRGQINFTGNMDGSGTWLIDIVSKTDIDYVNIGGDVDFTNMTIDFNDITGIDNGWGPYIFGKYDGTRTGSFGTVNNIPAGYWIDYNYGGTGQLALIPEVGTVIPLAALFAPILLRRQRRRGAKLNPTS